MPLSKWIPALALIVIVIAASARAQPVLAAPHANAPDIDAALACPDTDHALRMRLELFRMVNEARAGAGLPPYELDARLMESANEHSEDMATGGFCRHTGRDGSSSRTRIRHHGYPFNNWVGENIICGRKTPKRAMQWWLSSGPHSRNIFHGHYTHIGIGYHPHGPYGPMWTLNFGAGSAETVHPRLPGQAATAGIERHGDTAESS